MHIMEIIYPGTRLSGLDAASTDVIEDLLELIMTQLFNACIARSFFDLERARRVADLESPLDGRKLWEKETQLKKVVEEELDAELDAMGPPFGQAGWVEAYQRRQTRIEVEVKRRKWASGAIPREFENRIILLHARSILYAFDTFNKTLGALIAELEKQKQTSLSDKIKQIKIDYATCNLYLNAVRNSAHHLEDRVRDLSNKGKIPALPLGEGENVGGFITIGPGGMVGRITVRDTLRGDTLHFTIANGLVNHVDISISNIKYMQSCCQRVVDAFEWTGPPAHRLR
jgi:hypothetical protein